MSFGEKLKALREANAVDIGHLAEEIGVCRETIWRWEKDSVKPNAKFIRAIAKFFKVNVKELTGKE